MVEGKLNTPGAFRSPRFASSKFLAPKPASHVVRRVRLLEALDRGQRARLTLVVGPPGSGKTVLVADWLAARPDLPSAWLSCDAADANPVRLAFASIEALRRGFAEPQLGEDARQLLSADGEVTEDVIAALVDDLEQLDGPRVLVTDDLHLAGRAGADVVSLLLECRPPNLQLVVGTRVEPALRLHRMRASHELAELRERDLSFSSPETGLFLSRFGVRLSEEGVAAVQRRSEGWAAGLQMAAISMRQAGDPADAAGRVELGRHTIAGYFLDEVLYRQPPEVVEFMLATSILEELSAPACTGLCGPEAAALLERVYGDHLFVTMVDDQAAVYRYHQLIREVLRAELHARDPASEQHLHERAARHLAGANRIGPAARHLLEAGDPAGAFRLLRDGLILDFATNPGADGGLDEADVQPDDFAGTPDILVPMAADLLLRGAFERGSRAFWLARQAAIDPARQPELALRFRVVERALPPGRR